MTLTKEQRRARKAQHAQSVVRAALHNAADRGDWVAKTTARSVDGLPTEEVFERKWWKLTVHWGAGGRLSGATLAEATINPDTGTPALAGNGKWRWTFRYGQLARTRGKKDTLIRILTTPTHQLRTLAEELNER